MEGDSVVGCGVYGAMIRPKQAFLNVGVNEPVFDPRTAQHVVDATPKVARARVLPGVPAGVHARTIGMKLPAEIPKNGLFPPFISLSNDTPSKHQMVEEAPRRSRQVLVKRHVLLPEALHQAGGVQLGADDVEVTAEEDLLSHGDQVPDPDVDGIDVRLTKLDSCVVPGGRAIDSNENEGREFEDHATPFRVERLFVHFVGELPRSRISADLLVFREISESG
jgi:hypothetical protein